MGGKEQDWQLINLTTLFKLLKLIPFDKFHNGTVRPTRFFFLKKMNPPQDAHKFVQAHVQHNGRQLQYIRSCFAAIAGSAAGILGLTNLSGFLFYALCWIVLSVLLLSRTSGGSKYFMNGYKDIVFNGAVGGLLSFVLFHTLLYGLVHLYQ
jgi:hypothetical protein